MGKGSYGAFLNALGRRESNSDYTVVATLGYLGKYQFGELALIDVGLYTADGTAANDWKAAYWTGKYGIASKEDFLASPEAQEAAIRAYMELQWSYLKAVHQYDGQVIGGIALTVSGMLAGAHLVGANSLTRFLKAGGDPVMKDAYGTPVTEYLDRFSFYDTPFAADHSKGETVVGGSQRDILRGRGGDDVLEGGRGKDKLLGGPGRDVLDGGPGADRLKGGKGADTFVFRDKPGKNKVDVIVDFKAGEDAIHLDRSVFKGLPAGPLDAGAFCRGKAARDADDRIVYHKKSGALFYDADGDGPGGAVQFAKLANKAALTHADFFVI